jgi:hypothetical protein
MLQTYSLRLRRESLPRALPGAVFFQTYGLYNSGKYQLRHNTAFQPRRGRNIKAPGNARGD